jgi:hypothetical protein
MLEVGLDFDGLASSSKESISPGVIFVAQILFGKLFTLAIDY